jgi:hypothetical protein
MVWIDTYKRQKKQGLDRKSRLDLNHRADETKPIQCRTIEGVMFGGEMARPYYAEEHGPQLLYCYIFQRCYSS